MDRIELLGIEAYGYHGVLESERASGQRFVLDVRLEADLSVSARSDELADTVDYGVLSQRVVEIASGPPFALIEALAGALLDVCLEEPIVRAAEVTVHKPDAPVSVEVGDISVTLRRERA